MKRYRGIGVAALFGGLVGWLLWPLSSPEFAIPFDEAGLSRKERLLAANTPTDTARRPNIVLILADDLGIADLSCYGNPQIQTPNIDRIGVEGVRFTTAYVTAPICSPSRAGLLTGRYQQRFGYEFQPHDRYLRNRLEYLGFRFFVRSHPWRIPFARSVPRKEDILRQGLPPGEITLADWLHSAGYATACIGKWHLGNRSFARPRDFGFEHFFGFYASHSLYAPQDDTSIVHTRNPRDWTDSYIWGSGRNGDHAIFRNDRPVEERGYLTFRFAEEAVHFIETNRDRPFFLYLAFNAPHTPLQAPRSYVQRFAHIEDPVRRTYLAMIAALDDAVGTVYRTLDSLDLLDETLIFFLSDNGGATYTHTTDNAPFRGGKLTQFEGGLRVPFLMQWRGQLPPGQQFEAPVLATDIFATATAAAGLSLPLDRPYDGRNLLPFLKGPAPTPLPRPFLWRMGRVASLRLGDLKVILNQLSRDTLLFDLAADPYERHDLSSHSPDRLTTVLPLLEELTQELSAPLWPPVVLFEWRDSSGVWLFEN